MSLRTIKLEKGIYQEAEKPDGLSLSQYLEKEDPSEEYKGTIYANTDAFQRQLIARGLVGNDIKLAAFYDSADTVLFPEIISRAINSGKIMSRNHVMLQDMIALSTPVDGGVYKGPNFDIDTDEMAMIPEGSPIPEVVLSTSFDTVNLLKYGRSLNITYEAQRRSTSLNYFTKFLQLMGMKWAKQQAAAALTVAMSGITPDIADGDLDYEALVEFAQSFDPYDATLLIGPKAAMVKLLTMSAFMDQAQKEKYQETGEYPTPFGAAVKRFSPSSPSLTDKLVGIDTEFGIEHVYERQASLVEYDKIIGKQWDKIVISEVVGFRRLQDSAVRVLSYTPA